MLRVFTSNQLEALADEFVERFKRSVADPLEPLTVIVPSLGTGQWLQQSMAERLGIAAQFDIQLPSTFAWTLFRAFDPSLPKESDFSLDRLRWRLFRLLPTLQAAAYAPLQAYLEDADAGRAARKQYQLATRLAVLFDQYLVYRSDWIRSFAGAPLRHPHEAALFSAEPWQQPLWHALLADIGHSRHRAEVFEEVLGKLIERVPEHAAAIPEQSVGVALPRRLSLFAVPALPPDLTLLFGALGMHVDVDVYLPNACQMYWADIVGPRALAWRGSKRPNEHASEHYFESGHPLLASCGRMNRDGVDLFNELVDALGEDAELHEGFVEPGGDSALARLQSDVLSLVAPGPREARLPVQHTDNSIGVHVCHSVLREVEVLHDRLLAAFAADASLEPRHIVVMVPDLERYAPVLDAVFGSVPAARRIPVAIADRLDEGAGPILAALHQVLRLDSSRWTLSEVLALLDIPAIQERFELTDDRLLQVRHWLLEAGVRWGRDARDWIRRGLPTEADAAEAAGRQQPNTWAFGIERLMLGYAMPDGAPLFDGVAALDGVEGGSARTLDGLLRLQQTLQQISAALGIPATAVQWQRRIEGWVDALFAPDADDRRAFLALNSLRDVLRRLVLDAGAAGGDLQLPVAVLREHLERALAQPAESPRYRSGALTVCTLLPMRSLPFRQVHLLGMNERDFPRQSTPVGFDLMARAPRKGDRVRRDEDRQLFLDAVLSAREQLHVSYVGEDDRSGNPRNPSVVVSELLEVLEGRFSGVDRLVHRYPLQPFSAQYDDVNLVTFEDLWTSVRAAQPEPSRGRTTTVHLSRAATEQPELRFSPAQLRAFMRRPARWCLRECLDVRLPEALEGLEDEEPVRLDGLDTHNLKAEALDALRAGALDVWQEHVSARGVLPPGFVGRQRLAALSVAVRQIAELHADDVSAVTASKQIDLRLPGVHIEGELDRIGADGYLHVRVGKHNARDISDAYLAQLLLCASSELDDARAGAVAWPASRLVDESAQPLRLRSVPATTARARLVAIARLCAEAQATPVPLLVDTAQKWMTSGSLDAAHRAWGAELEALNHAGEQSRNERFQEDVRLLWGDLETPPDGWLQCAETVYGLLQDVLPAVRGRAGKEDEDDARGDPAAEAAATAVDVGSATGPA